MQFLPQEGRVRLIKRVELAVEYESQKDGAKEWRETGPIECLILTNSALDTVFLDLLQWRKKCGFNAQIRDIEWITAHCLVQDDAEKLGNYLKICAQGSGLQWVLFGGDVDIIPVRKTFAMACSAGLYHREGSLPCDLYYSDLDGDWDFNNNGIFGETADSVDLYPDIFVDRIPVKTPREARGFVGKLLAYEKGLCNQYQTRALFSAAVLWNEPYTDEGRAKDRIEERYLPEWFNPVYKLYESRMAITTDTAKSLLNFGCGIFNHCGHGWIDVICLSHQAYLRNSDMDELTNSARPGIGYSIGCWTTAFDYDAIAEHFITNPQGGGVAFIGNSSYGWGSPGNPGFGYSDRFDARFLAELFNFSQPRIGEILIRTKIHFIPYSYEANVYRWYQFCLNLLGDPAMPVHTDTFKAMYVYKPSYLPLGKCPTRITVLNNNGPVVGARVCLSRDDKIYVRGSTGLDGTVLLEPEFTTLGTTTISVTAPNHYPVQDSIPVSFGTNLSLTRFQRINSANETSTFLSPGESFSLLLSIRNTGSTRTTGLDCRLATNSPLITIRDNSGLLPSLPPDSEVSTRLFLLHCSPAARNGQFALCWLTITDSGGSSCEFPLPLSVGLSQLKMAGFYFTRSHHETVRLFVQVVNTGLAEAKVPTETIFDPQYGEPGSPYLHLIAPGFILPTIPPGETAWSLTPSQFIPFSPSARVGVNLTTGGYNFSDTLNLYLGTAGLSETFDSGAEGWTTGDSNGNWRLSAKRSHSPSFSYYIGNETGSYPDNSSSWLLSPTFYLPAKAELKFYRWFSVPIYGVDGLYVILITRQGEDTLDFIGSGGALGLGPLGIVSDWVSQAYDLSRYPAPESAQLKFVFVSDNDGRTGEGFYIDDIQVASSEIPPAPFPETTQLLPLFPNPVKSRTPIVYSLAVPGFVRLALFDITGRNVRTLVNERKPAGYFAIGWDGKNDKGTSLPPGVYLLRLLGDNSPVTRFQRKIVKIK